MTAPFYDDGAVTVFLGDCLDVLRTLPDASVDAVVTDPPYELGFMGNTWDKTGDAFKHQVWAECLRILKPGGHLLAFGATRTYHRLTCAIEDAGFEVRDSLHWIYGTGVPKGIAVDRAIDQAGGASPAEQARTLKTARERAGLTRQQLADAVGCTLGSIRDWEDGRARAAGRAREHIVPSPAYRARLAELLGYTSDEREKIGVGDLHGRTVYRTGSIARYGGPNTPAARAWEGWSTALKPAHEPIVLACRPPNGTVADNVLTHRTGALNVKECGVSGRWPANVLFTHAPDCGQPDEGHPCKPACPVAELDEQTQGPSFFPVFRYERKAAASERPRLPDGTTHPTVKPLALMRWLVRLVTPPGGTVLDPFAGSGATGEAAVIEGFRALLIEREEPYAELIKVRLGKPISPVLDFEGEIA